MTTLHNVQDVLDQIGHNFQSLPGELVDILDVYDRILVENISSPVDLPPFANSSMDGYAVKADDIVHASEDQPVQLDVVMDIQAGVNPGGQLEPGQAARIMTGAVVPPGADAVMPVENTDATWVYGERLDLPSTVGIFQSARPGDNIRPVGENVRKGEPVLTAGNVLRPQDVGMLAALGVPKVNVVRKPRVAVLSSGDELLRPDQPLEPGKIRDVNTYTLTGLVRSCGAEVIHLPIARDSSDSVRQLFGQALDRKPDLVIASAGVSVGAADLVRNILEEMGEINLWRINLRPGKPLAFGRLGDVPFFGLPGNPVSVMVTFDVIVRPMLLKLAGRSATSRTIQAEIQEPFESDGRRSYIRVKLSKNEGRWIASTTGTQSSGALMSMVVADGLLIVPENVKQVLAGQQFEVRLLRDFVE